MDETEGQGEFELTNGRYILVGHIPVEEPDLMRWARWFENPDNRRVDQTQYNDVMVSTVFLGLDHRFEPYGQPILFETMIFGGKHDQYQERYSTWDQAVEGHAYACRMVEAEGVVHKIVKN